MDISTQNNKDRKLKAYSIRDIKATIFIPPYYNPNDQVAIRTFSDILQNPHAAISKHPEDYQLHHVGFFNEETGVLEGCPVSHVIDASTLLNQLT